MGKELTEQEKKLLEQTRTNVEIVNHVLQTGNTDKLSELKTDDVGKRFNIPTLSSNAGIEIKMISGVLTDSLRTVLNKFDKEEDSTLTQKGVRSASKDGYITKQEFSAKLDEMLEKPGETLGLFQENGIFKKKDPLIEGMKTEINAVKFTPEQKAAIKEMALAGFDEGLKLINQSTPKFVPDFHAYPINAIVGEAKKILPKALGELDANKDAKLTDAEFESVTKKLSIGDVPEDFTPSAPTVKAEKPKAKLATAPEEQKPTEAPQAPVEPKDPTKLAPLPSLGPVILP